MKTKDIWTNTKQPDIYRINPKGDKRRMGWNHELDVIDQKVSAMYRKLIDGGKVLNWDDEREDILTIKMHQSSHFRVVNNEEGRKIGYWFGKMEQRRDQLQRYLLDDLAARGPPHAYKKEKKKRNEKPST